MEVWARVCMTKVFLSQEQSQKKSPSYYSLAEGEAKKKKVNSLNCDSNRQAIQTPNCKG